MTPNEKQKLTQRFEAICPWLSQLDNYGWVEPVTGSVYQMYDPDHRDSNYKPFKIDVAAGTHTDIVYRLNGEKRYVEGTM